MGIRISRISRSTAALLRPPPPSRASSDPTPNSTTAAAGHSSPDLSSDDADPDSSVQLRTSHAINSIAVSIDAPEVSLDALSQVIDCRFETNQQVIRAVLLNKRDVWKNLELSDLVDDYFESTLVTQDFCTALDACLQRAGHIEFIITLALRRFQEEHYSTNEEGIERNYSESCLGNFTAAGDPFTEDFLELSTSIYSRQIGMFERLQAMKPKLDQKVKRLKARRRVSNSIFIAAFAFVLICSVVAATVSFPPVVTALAAAAASVPLVSIGKWLNSIWKRYERDLWGQTEIIRRMQMGSYLVLIDVVSIMRLVERFKIVAGDLVAKDYSPTRRDAAVEELKQKVDSLIKTIQDMRERGHNCSQETRMARISIMRRIINHPSSSNQEISMFSDS